MEGPLNFPSDITLSFTTCCNFESLLLPNGLKGLLKKSGDKKNQKQNKKRH